MLKSDPGYSKNAFGTKIIFNGEIIQWCHTADEEKGIVIRHKRDDSRELITHEGFLVNETLKGNVVVKLREKEPEKTSKLHDFWGKIKDVRDLAAEILKNGGLFF